MPIDSTTNFTRYQCDAGSTPDGKRVIKRISVNQGVGEAQFRGYLRPINNNYQEGWNPNDSEFQEIQSRVEEGRVRAEYKDRHGTVYVGSALPAHLEWMREADPIAREIDLTSAAEGITEGPAVLVVYASAETQPSDEPPLFNATNDTVSKWVDAIEASGVHALSPPSVTTPNLLWTNKANYFREGDEFSCHWTGWATAARRYSYDNAVTWELTPRAEAWQLTHVQTFNSDTNTWETEPVSPRFQGITGQGSAVSVSSSQRWTNGNAYVGARTELPRRHGTATRGLNAGNTVRVGIEMKWRTDWNTQPKLIGQTDIPFHLVPLVSPHEVASGVLAAARKTFLIKMDSRGAVSWGLIDSADALDEGDEHRFTCYFRSNANGVLRQAINGTDQQTVLRFSNRPTDIDVGTRLYISSGGNIENTGVVAVNHALQGSGATAGYDITVTRGGSSKAAHPVGAKVTADHATIQHATFWVTGKGEFHAASEIFLHRQLDQ